VGGDIPVSSGSAEDSALWITSLVPGQGDDSALLLSSEYQRICLAAEIDDAQATFVVAHDGHRGVIRTETHDIVALLCGADRGVDRK
jgi:hypothetical protein